MAMKDSYIYSLSYPPSWAQKITTKIYCAQCFLFCFVFFLIREIAVIQTTEVQGTRAQAPCKKFFQNFNMKMYAVMLHQHLTYHRRPNLTIRGIDQI